MAGCGSSLQFSRPNLQMIFVSPVSPARLTQHPRRPGSSGACGPPRAGSRARPDVTFPIAPIRSMLRRVAPQSWGPSEQEMWCPRDPASVPAARRARTTPVSDTFVRRHEDTDLAMAAGSHSMRSRPRSLPSPRSGNRHSSRPGAAPVEGSSHQREHVTRSAASDGDHHFPGCHITCSFRMICAPWCPRDPPGTSLALSHGVGHSNSGSPAGPAGRMT